MVYTLVLTLRDIEHFRKRSEISVSVRIFSLALTSARCNSVILSNASFQIVNNFPYELYLARAFPFIFGIIRGNPLLFRYFSVKEV